MNADLKSMSRKQLEKQLKDVKKALEGIKARERREAKKAAERVAAQFGFSLRELTGDAKDPEKAAKTKVKAPKSLSKPKYANPEDSTQTWTGKGRQPNWYRAGIAKGLTPIDMAIH